MKLVNWFKKLSPVIWYFQHLHQQDLQIAAGTRERISEACSELYLASQNLEEEVQDLEFRQSYFCSDDEKFEQQRRLLYFSNVSIRMQELYCSVTSGIAEFERRTSPKAVNNFLERYDRFQSLLEKYADRSKEDSNL